MLTIVVCHGAITLGYPVATQVQPDPRTHSAHEGDLTLQQRGGQLRFHSSSTSAFVGSHWVADSRPLDRRPLDRRLAGSGTTMWPPTDPTDDPPSLMLR